MAATYKLSSYSAHNSPSVFASILSVILAGLQRLSRALKNRRQAEMLAGMDDRMLADIGLNRSDLRDAYAEPLWRDPTDVLAGRARDRRTHRLRPALEASHVSAPSISPDRCFSALPANRSARTTM